MNGNNIEEKWEDVLTSNASISQKNYPTMQQTSVWAKELFTNSDAHDSIESTFNALNQNLAKLDFIQNELNVVDNLYKETLLKQSELIKLENEDLKKQLQELELIQANISNKDRLIEQTNFNIASQELNIYVLAVSCVLAIFLIATIYAYGIGTISMSIFGSIVSFIVLVYAILFIYSYNIFYFRDAMTYLGDRQRKGLQWGYHVKRWSEIKSNVDAKKEYIKDEWIENNCDCPVTEEEDIVAEEVLEEDYRGTRVMGKIFPDIPGYFYYDGSSPQQLLLPTPDSKKLNDKVDWVDYSPNGQMQYIKAINKNVNINDNYYNYKTDDNTKSSLLAKAVENNSTLVNNTTYSANM